MRAPPPHSPPILACPATQEERDRLHAEMAKMQSLEEEALLTGKLAMHGGKCSATGSIAKGAAADGRGRVGKGIEDDGDGEEPQTDGDETDSYSDQVSTQNRCNRNIQYSTVLDHGPNFHNFKSCVNLHYFPISDPTQP